MICTNCGSKARGYMRDHDFIKRLYVVCDTCGNRGWLFKIMRDPERYQFRNETQPPQTWHPRNRFDRMSSDEWEQTIYH